MLAINGYVIRTLVQAQWFEDTTFTQDLGDFQWSLPVWIGIGCIIGVWLISQHLRHPAGRLQAQLRDGGNAHPPGRGADVPPLHRRRLVDDNMTWEIGAGGEVSAWP